MAYTKSGPACGVWRGARGARARTCVCVCMCVHLCVRECVRVCVCVCMCAVQVSALICKAQRAQMHEALRAQQVTAHKKLVHTFKG